MDLENIIRTTLVDVAEAAECTLILPIENDTVLLKSGLDSLGFAMLVAQLEEDLDIDPFSDMDIAVYPKTLSEFVAIYEQAMKAK